MRPTLIATLAAGSLAVVAVAQTPPGTTTTRNLPASSPEPGRSQLPTPPGDPTPDTTDDQPPSTAVTPAPLPSPTGTPTPYPSPSATPTPQAR
jgi:hypothetical protein